MDTVGGNPFAVLTAVVAPAILANACLVLALGTSNRVAPSGGAGEGINGGGRISCCAPLSQALRPGLNL
jgi:hypothetical protein